MIQNDGSQWKVGDRVRIPKGTRIVRDMHPQAPDNAYAHRSLTVTIDHFLALSCGGSGRYRRTIRWAGRGGYWREVWANEVEAA